MRLLFVGDTYPHSARGGYAQLCYDLAHVLRQHQLPLLSEQMFFDLHHTNAEGTDWLSELVSREALAQAWQNWDSFAASRAGPLAAYRD